MSRSEAARHAALVRWKKKNPLGARLQAIREKRKTKKGKAAKPTPEQREAQRAAEAQANRQKTLSALGIPEDAAGALDDLAMGTPTDDDGGLEKLGLAERGKDGTLRLTAAGKAFYNAASKGDLGAAKDAMSRAKDKTIEAGEQAQATADKEKAALDKEKAKADKEKEAAPKAGGGGGGGKEKPSDEEKEAERKEKADKKKQATRDDIKEKMAQGDTGLSPRGFDAFTEFADGGPMDSASAAGFASMGLTEGDPPRLTEAGRSLRNAIDRGDLRGAVDVVERGKSKKAEGDERTKAKEEKDRERTDRERDEEKPTRRSRLRDRIRIRATKDTDMEQLDKILDIVERLDELDDAEIKAGKRNKGSDQALIDEGYALSEQLCALFTELGATEEEEVEGGEIEMKTPEQAELVYGSAIKALDGDTIGGFAVLFGSSDMPDLSEHRDYFTKSTDYWLDRFGWPRPMTYHHGLDPDTADDPIVGQWTKAIVKDEGIWLEGQLSRAHRYHGAIKELVRRGYLKLSSDSAPQWVLRERQPNGANEVKRWPLITASPTVIPAEPRIGGLSFKTLLAELGLDAIEDDDQEATDPETARPDEVKAATEARMRRALIELDLLSLETIA